MERLGTSPSRGTSPTWGPPLPCKQALRRQWIMPRTLAYELNITILLLQCVQKSTSGSHLSL